MRTSVLNRIPRAISLATALLTAALMVSCGESSADRAEALLSEAGSAFRAGKWGEAIALTDSIDRSCRHEIDFRRKAHALRDSVHLREAERDALYFDSLVALQKPVVEKMARDFTLSPDSAYSGLKVYNHKNQTRWYYPHNNLLMDVNERGEATLVSVYTGGELRHHALRVSSGEFFAETGDVPVGSACNNRFQDTDGTPWEYVSFTGKTDNGVMAFLHEYAGDRLKVTLQGDRGKYVYYLAKSDREALASAYEFAAALRDLYDFGRKSALCREKAAYLASKLNKKDIP